MVFLSFNYRLTVFQQNTKTSYVKRKNSDVQVIKTSQAQVAGIILVESLHFGISEFILYFRHTK